MAERARAGGRRPQKELSERIDELLADPAHEHNPLRPALVELQAYCRAQDERLERLLRIADGYYAVARHDSRNQLERYERHVRRLEKLARISDRYQRDLRQMAETLREAALRDPLTGLGNRRFLMDRLQQEAEAARQNGTGFVLALVDIDYFKSINDNFGHEIGDQVLCRFAETLASTLREYDVCGRWGGEEFVILLPGTTLDAAARVIERLRAAIATMPLPMLGEGQGITASFGLAAFDPAEPLTRLLNRADAALYAAKNMGRNRLHLG